MTPTIQHSQRARIERYPRTMTCNEEDWVCSNETGHLRARLAGKGSKVLLYRFALSEDISSFSDSAMVVAPEADPVFVFKAALNQLIVVLLNISNHAQVNVDIDLGCKQEVEVVGEPERLATIDSITAKDIACQPPKSSLYSEKNTSSFFEMVTVSDNRFKLPYDPELTVKDLKLLTLCFNFHRRFQFNDAIHLFFLATELTNDFQKLSEIPRFGLNSVIHIAHSSGRAPIQFDSPYLANFNNIEILLRNANECNKFAKKNTNTRERERFSEPSFDVEINESFGAFGDLTERIGQLMVSYSTQLNRLADVLDKDERMSPNSRKYDEAKQIIQNNLDTARYAGPMMKNFSSVRVDITNNRLNYA